MDGVIYKIPHRSERNCQPNPKVYPDTRDPDTFVNSNRYRAATKTHQAGTDGNSTTRTNGNTSNLNTTNDGTNRAITIK